MSIIFENGIYREEIQEEKKQSALYNSQLKYAPLPLTDLITMQLKTSINTMKLDDDTALRAKEFYPTFEEIIGKEVELDFKFTYNGKLYKVIQLALTPQKEFPPSIDTASLYSVINEKYEGTMEEPIPYDKMMAVEKGKYYFYNNELYVCLEDSINPLYFNPDEQDLSRYLKEA